MNLFLLLIFILSCYGISNMVVYSNGPFHIFIKWREISEKISPMFGELFSCMMCFPFWAGVLLSSIDLFLIKSVSFTPLNILLGNSNNWLIMLFILIMDGSISSGSVWIIHNIEEHFELSK